MKIIVYTCITNGKDTLKDVPVDEGVDYYCFSDEPFEHPVWKYLPVEEEGSPRETARKYKALSHEYFPEAWYTIWVDSGLELLVSPKKLIEDYLTTSFISSRPHLTRCCIYRELDAVEELGFETSVKVNSLRSFYRKQGFPESYGLAETGLLIRDNLDPDTIKFNNAWWKMIKIASLRDQCSFDYLMWKHNWKYDKIPRETVRHHNHLTNRGVLT